MAHRKTACSFVLLNTALRKESNMIGRRHRTPPDLVACEEQVRAARPVADDETIDRVQDAVAESLPCWRGVCKLPSRTSKIL
jgi:hypothetical protein